RLWQGPGSALTEGQTGGPKGMAAVFDGVGPGATGEPPGPAPSASSATTPPFSPSAPPAQCPAPPASPGGEAPVVTAHPDAPHGDPVSGHEECLPRRTTDKAMQLEAKSAEQAPASQLRANEQLPRGTLGQLADQRAREPYGRDRPDARNRAGESTARIQ